MSDTKINKNSTNLKIQDLALPPLFAQIEPVGQCNLRCQMCPIQFRHDGPPHGPLAFMDYSAYCRIIDDLSTLKTLHLQGLGEPLMHPRFFDMVSYAVKKGINVSTNTNLTLLNYRRARACISSGLNEIHVSIDGATAKVFERIRQRARFTRIMRNLNTLMSERKAAATNTPSVRLITVIMRQNLHELPDLVGLAHRYGIESMFVQHLCHDFSESSLPHHYAPMRRFVEEQTLLNEDPQRIEKYFSAARSSAETLGIRLRLPRTKPRPYEPTVRGKNRCNWPWHGPYISYKGDAMPCCMVATPDRVNFGNVISNGAKETWNNADYNAFRQELDSALPPEVCRTCAIYQGTF